MLTGTEPRYKSCTLCVEGGCNVVVSYSSEYIINGLVRCICIKYGNLSAALCKTDWLTVLHSLTTSFLSLWEQHGTGPKDDG